MDESKGTGFPEKRKLRVAIVAPTLGILGGHSIQAQRLIEQWANDGDIETWLVPINPMPPGPLRHLLAIKYLRTVLTQLIYWPRLLFELRRADVVHVFSASYTSFLLSPLPAILVARALRRPVVLNYHSGEAGDHLRRSRLARSIIAKCERTVVPSRYLVDVFAGHAIDATAIPNVVDIKRFAYRERTPLRPRILSVRNFESLYNVACTLRAFQLVQRRWPNAELTLVGSGSEEPRLRALARELALERVTFTGRIEPAQMAGYYASHDIYVQTPDIDNMPISVLEAYASGLPVVSTDAGGVPSILTHDEDGLLAPVGDHAGIARHILRLLEQPGIARDVARSGYKRCETFTWPNVRDLWLSEYREARRAYETQPAAALSMNAGAK